MDDFDRMIMLSCNKQIKDRKIENFDITNIALDKEITKYNMVAFDVTNTKSGKTIRFSEYVGTDFDDDWNCDHRRLERIKSNIMINQNNDLNILSIGRAALTQIWDIIENAIN